MYFYFNTNDLLQKNLEKLGFITQREMICMWMCDKMLSEWTTGHNVGVSKNLTILFFEERNTFIQQRLKW